MNPLIRPEAPDDARAIEAVILAAFADHPHSHQTEHLLVDALRAAGALSCALVATLEERILGHIAFSAVGVEDGAQDWHILAPLSVHPDAQGHGLGSLLLEAGMDAIADAGAQGCVVVGEPSWYGRRGFAPATSLRLDGIPAGYLLARSLGEPVPAGRLALHPAFAICS